MGSKVMLILALDGFCNEIYEKVLKLGGFNNLKKILGQGDVYPAQINLCSRGWPVVFTGMNAGEYNGYYYLVNKKTYDFVEKFSLSDYERHAVWSEGGGASSELLVMGIPTTYPPAKINGVFISAGAAGNFPGGIESMVFPSDALERYPLLKKQYIADVRGQQYHSSAKYLEALINATKIRTRVALDIFRDRSPGTVLIGYVGCDRIAHSYWPYLEGLGGEGDETVMCLIKEYFNVLDRSIKSLVEEMDPELFVIVSDHGLTGRKKTLYINKLLVDMGFANAAVSVKENMKEWVRKVIVERGSPRLRGTIKRWAKVTGRAVGGIALNAPSLDWKKTRAFGSYMHGVYINRKGEYSCGVVSDEEYEALRNEIIARFEGVKDEEGVIFEKVMKREDVFNGKYLCNAPDIVFELRDGIEIRGEVNVEEALCLFQEKYYSKSDEPGVHNGIHSRWPFLYVRSRMGFKKDVSEFGISSVYDLIVHQRA